jgi:hypothetical protein
MNIIDTGITSSNNPNIAPLETVFTGAIAMPDEIVEVSNSNLITELSASVDLIVEVSNG